MTELNGKCSIGIIERDGKVLVMKRAEHKPSGGRWNFPGGKIENGETPREAAIREVREEAGVEPEVKREGEFFYSETSDRKWEVYPYLMESEDEIELNEEHTEFKWVHPSELEEFDTIGPGKALEILGLNAE